MLEYVLRLFILVPLVGGMAWGSLWLWRKLQLGMPANGQADRSLKMIDVVTLGTSGKLAVVEFGDRELVIAISRTQISLLAERHKGDFHA